MPLRIGLFLETGNRLTTMTTRLAYARRPGGVFLLVLVGSINSTLGQSPLPVVDDADVHALRVPCRELLEGLAKGKAARPPEADRELRALLEDGKKPSDESAGKSAE